MTESQQSPANNTISDPIVVFILSKTDRVLELSIANQTHVETLEKRQQSLEEAKSTTFDLLGKHDARLDRMGEQVVAFEFRVADIEQKLNLTVALAERVATLEAKTGNNWIEMAWEAIWKMSGPKKATAATIAIIILTLVLAIAIAVR